jgi:flagellar hook protein FlgE
VQEIVTDIADGEVFMSRMSLRVRPEWNPDPALQDPIGDGEFQDLLGMHIQPNGQISVILNNRPAVIGIIGVAMFSNFPGLMRAGNSLYEVGPNSGDPVYVLPGQDGSGALQAGGLEMSNVDLATEFTDMIVTQRGFQANSRVITVSDSMLEELVNLKR